MEITLTLEVEDVPEVTPKPLDGFISEEASHGRGCSWRICQCGNHTFWKVKRVPLEGKLYLQWNEKEDPQASLALSVCSACHKIFMQF